jgi:hypothetical protein
MEGRIKGAPSQCYKASVTQFINWYGIKIFSVTILRSLFYKWLWYIREDLSDVQAIDSSRRSRK